MSELEKIVEMIKFLNEFCDYLIEWSLSTIMVIVLSAGIFCLVFGPFLLFLYLYQLFGK